MPPGYFTQSRNIRDPQGRIGDALRIDGARAIGDGSLDCVQVRDVDECRAYPGFWWQQVMKQRISSAIYSV